MYLSKTKKSKCCYCSKEMVDYSLKQNCKEIHGKAKLVKGQKTLTFILTQGTPPPPPPLPPPTKKTKQKQKGKSDYEENLDSNCSVV